MKKVLFLFVLALISGQIQAQIIQGSKLVTGNFNFQYYTQKTGDTQNKNMLWGLGANHQWFIKDNQSFDLGTGISYSSNQNNGSSTTGGVHYINKGTSLSTAISLNLGYNKYFPLSAVHKDLFFVLSGDFTPGYIYNQNISKVELIENNVSTKTENTINQNRLGASLSLSPGLSFRLREKWLLSTTFGSAALNFQKPISSSNKDYSIGGNLNFSPVFWGFGVGYFLK